MTPLLEDFSIFICISISSQTLLSILESSYYGSEKLSELYFFMCEYH